MFSLNLRWGFGPQTNCNIFKWPTIDICFFRNIRVASEDPLITDWRDLKKNSNSRVLPLSGSASSLRTVCCVVTRGKLSEELRNEEGLNRVRERSTWCSRYRLMMILCWDAFRKLHPELLVSQFSMECDETSKNLACRWENIMWEKRLDAQWQSNSYSAPAQLKRSDSMSDATDNGADSANWSSQHRFVILQCSQDH